jgi:hypothetical protein
MQSRYALISGTVFGVVAVLQAVRAFNEWPVQVGPFAVPIWFSWLAFAVTAGLCLWAFNSKRA